MNTTGHVDSARVAFEELLARVPSYELTKSPSWFTSPWARALTGWRRGAGGSRLMLNELRDLDFNDMGSAPLSVRYLILTILLVIILAIGYFLLVKTKVEQLLGKCENVCCATLAEGSGVHGGPSVPASTVSDGVAIAPPHSSGRSCLVSRRTDGRGNSVA